MSVNCVDVAVDLANEVGVPLMLVASRRQIECESMGGGYVNNWTTEQFAAHVRRRDRSGQIVLCRDHGGPWQGTDETSAPVLSLPDAMDRAKQSFAADIAAGMSIIHVDPSIDPFVGTLSVGAVLDRVFELLHYCWQVAQDLRHDIVFEIGTEEQASTAASAVEADHVLSEVDRFCRSCGVPGPMFVVLQTGTKVIETRNVGTFASPLRMAKELPAELQVPLCVDLLRRYNVHLKVHNGDYLNDECLAWVPRLGISAVNVAPEFGVLETRTLLSLLRTNDLNDLVDRFVALAYDSGKWRKWMAPDTNATTMDRAVIAGHYVFGTPEFSEIYAEAEQRLGGRGLDPTKIIRERLKAALLRYLTLFRTL